MRSFKINCLALLCVSSLLISCLDYGFQFENERVARAEIDECFSEIGDPYKPGPDCDADEIPKANQAYLWGLTKSGDKLWFGTAANMLCLTRAYRDYVRIQNSDDPDQDYKVMPYINNLWMCEYHYGHYIESEMNEPDSIPPVFNDYRPPQIYTYDVNTKALTSIADRITDVGAQNLLQSTFGLRSAASIGNIVFLSGPKALAEGINMFAFNAATGDLIGYTTIYSYQNIRKWLNLNGDLYAAVASETDGGRILRWTGSEQNPFSFVEVGYVDGGATEIIEHEGRIYVGTWPNKNDADGDPAIAGIWMSPEIPDGGLTEEHLNAWQKVWQADEYEPDPLNAKMYGCGPLASYGGYIYWGTMHVQAKAAVLFLTTYGMTVADFPITYLNSWRATSIFRAKNFDTDKEVELLYGKNYLSVYDENTSSWTLRNNNMGVYPKYGSAGFGNKYNNYTWSMAVYKDSLFVGTMDHSYLWLDWENLEGYYLKDLYVGIPYVFDYLPTISENEYGADLWRFPDTDTAAIRVTNKGLGNYANYGFRSVVVDEDTGLYLGTANATNVFLDDDGNSRSGWELHRIYAK